MDQSDTRGLAHGGSVRVYEGAELTGDAAAVGPVAIVDTLAALDLASCTVPRGAPCQSPATQPDNAPVCFVHDASGDRALVTLRGGGLVMIDARATPMRVVAAWDSATVHGNGCGGGRSGGRVFVTSGGGMGGHLHEFDLYEFPESGWTGTTAAPAPRLGDGGRAGQLQRIVRISNLDAGGVERSDPHGIAVRSCEPR